MPGTYGENCDINVNECQSNPCLNQGQCVDKINGFECRCLPGYRGRLCEEDVNECVSSPCLHGGQCTDLINDYSCRCKPGWYGKRCQTDVDEVGWKIILKIFYFDILYSVPPQPVPPGHVRE